MLERRTFPGCALSAKIARLPWDTSNRAVPRRSLCAMLQQADIEKGAALRLYWLYRAAAQTDARVKLPLPGTQRSDAEKPEEEALLPDEQLQALCAETLGSTEPP